MNTRVSDISTAKAVPYSVVDALESAFVAMGKAGANHDTAHPQREAWEKTRASLKMLGAL